MWLKISKRNKTLETAEEETETDPTVEAETTQETTIGMAIEMNIIEIEVGIVETIADIEIGAEEEIDPILEKEEGTNLDLDQVKGTLTEMTSAVSAIDLVI